MKTKTRQTNTGFKGIHLHKRGGYEARFSFGRTQKHLGTFKTVNEAIQARLKFIMNLV